MKNLKHIAIFFLVAGIGQMALASDKYTWTSVQSSDELWPAASAIDFNQSTVYSSHVFASSNNNRAVFLAAWTDFSKGAVSVNSILLTARQVGDNGVILGFPVVYDIFLTSADNSRWISIGRFCQQPDSFGHVKIDLPTTYQTFGMQVVPVTLGVDDYNNHYFQMADISFGKNG